MSIVDAARRAVGAGADTSQLPGYVKDRLNRGKEDKDQGASERTLAYRYWRGDQYWYLDNQGKLAEQASGGAGVSVKGQKEPHRVREPHNLIFGVVEGKVSSATQRDPGYTVLPSHPDQEAISGARTATKVALYGLDKWRLRQARVKCVTSALVAREGFAFPYFDTSVGPYEQLDDPVTGEPAVNDDGSPRLTGQGEVAIKTYGGNAVGWEPGVDFYESRWHFTEEAVAPEEVRAIPGFFGFKLKNDATTAERAPEKTAANSRLVILTQYFERPSAENPKGRFLRIVNQKLACPEEPFPCLDPDGDYLDEPPLHYLPYGLDPESHRGGPCIVLQCIPAQRTYNDCWNKLVEWKNRCLNPQMIAPRGSRFAPRKDDTPGAIFYYNPGIQKPEWERPPPIPQELFAMLDKSKAEIADIAAQFDINAFSGTVASSTVQATLENDQNRWQQFLATLADFDSRLMRHCLYLVARHYSEPRLIQINGDFGADPIKDFTGAKLRSQCDVRVSPDSLVNQTRAQIEQKIFAYADRGWISPVAAMAAINGGTAEALVLSYEKDVSRAHSIIQKIKAGPEMLFNSYRPRIDPNQPPDPTTGKPATIPGWMPRDFDNLDVHRSVFEDWMKTDEWDNLPPDMQEAALMYYGAVLQLQAQHQAQQAMAQQATAEALGMGNAAKPQDKPPPSMPSANGSPPPAPGATPQPTPS